VKKPAAKLSEPSVSGPPLYGDGLNWALLSKNPGGAETVGYFYKEEQAKRFAKLLNELEAKNGTLQEAQRKAAAED
jgi:hypothetical protein